MVKSKIIIISLICLILVSCFNQEEGKNITGNWYFIDYDNEDTIYNEVYIDSEYFIYYLDMQGFMSKQIYEISNDSISFYFRTKTENIKTNYKPKLQIINEEKFLLEDKEQTIEFKRLKNMVFSMDSIKNEEDNYLFEYHFYKRRNKYFFSLGYNVDTTLNEIIFEEETIEPVK
ncbi:MAG: hypothetical protein AB7S69_04545 [Salinivirgaceae bacterium]